MVDTNENKAVYGCACGWRGPVKAMKKHYGYSSNYAKDRTFYCCPKCGQCVLAVRERRQGVRP